ncbi:MAG: stage III sporulation protein AF [Oscillospiraceae bacterium]|nr:stage III sporulation protein AF [Oscillospiraceae bacterium]
METFRAISLTACFLGIVIAVFNSLYPSEKFAGQLKIIFSLIFILSLIKPIASGRFDLPEIAEAAAASSDYYESLGERADDYFVRSAESNISAVVESILHENEIYPEEVETSINISENYSISISEVKIALKNAADAESARRCVSEQIGNNVAVTVISTENGEEN